VAKNGLGVYGGVRVWPNALATCLLCPLSPEGGPVPGIDQASTTPMYKKKIDRYRSRIREFHFVPFNF